MALIILLVVLSQSTTNSYNKYFYKRILNSFILQFYYLLSISFYINVSKHSEYPVVSTIYGSGFGNINPSIVSVEFVQVNDWKTTIYISA